MTMNPGYVKPVRCIACGGRIYHWAPEDGQTCAKCRAPVTAVADEPVRSRSVQRRAAIMKGEPMPTFASGPTASVGDGAKRHGNTSGLRTYDLLASRPYVFSVTKTDSGNIRVQLMRGYRTADGRHEILEQGTKAVYKAGRDVRPCGCPECAQ